MVVSCNGSTTIQGIDYLGKNVETCGANAQLVFALHCLVMVTTSLELVYTSRVIWSEWISFKSFVAQIKQDQRQRWNRRWRLATLLVLQSTFAMALIMSAIKIQTPNALLGDNVPLTVVYSVWHAVFWCAGCMVLTLWGKTAIVPFNMSPSSSPNDDDSNRRRSSTSPLPAAFARWIQVNNPTFGTITSSLYALLVCDTVLGCATGMSMLLSLTASTTSSREAVVVAHFALIFCTGMLELPIVWFGGQRTLQYIDFMISAQASRTVAERDLALASKRARFARYIVGVIVCAMFSQWLQLGMVCSPFLRQQGSYVLPYLELSLQFGVVMGVYMLHSARLREKKPVDLHAKAVHIRVAEARHTHGRIVVDVT